MAEPRPAARGGAHPARELRYGSHPEQFGELRVPPAASASPVPVAVLLHGGFWLSRWKLDLMHPMAQDLARRGMASWNVEYRRADEHGWETMTADVEAAVRFLRGIAGPHGLDLDRVVLIGHSAGGQLAVRAAADLLAQGAEVRPAAVVSLAGVLDLAEADRRDLGDGAVAAALGGHQAQRPGAYAASSPVSLLPLGIRTVVVVARDDHPDLNDLSSRYVAAARSAGDRVTLIEGDGDHFTLIDPGSRLWSDTCEQLLEDRSQGSA
jgi:acetyl esterase/lipase